MELWFLLHLGLAGEPNPLDSQVLLERYLKRCHPMEVESQILAPISPGEPTTQSASVKAKWSNGSTSTGAGLRGGGGGALRGGIESPRPRTLIPALAG